MDLRVGRMTGRQYIVALAAVCFLAFGSLAGEAAEQGAKDLNFQVLRDGAPMGRHDITFERVGEELHVKVAIDLEVTFAFLTLFRYSHRNHEIWKDGRLLAIETETDDDGEAHWVRGRAEGDAFAVESSSGFFQLPADVIPTSYWHPDTVKQSQLLDSQHGRLLDLEMRPVVGASLPDAQRFAVTGDLDLDLWYEATGELAKIAFEARGSTIDYRLRDSEY